MATYNYATKESSAGLLDQKIHQSSYTDSIGTPVVQWFDGGKTFKTRSIATSGFKNHTRTAGWNKGEITDDDASYTVTQDRDIEFYVDQQDVNETNEELSMANISKEFIESQVTPELDSYRFSKITEFAKTAGQLQEEAITAANAYSKIKDTIKVVRRYGTANLLTYVSSDVMDALERSTEFNRSITNQNVGLTALESRVTSLDGVQIIEVQDPDRFNTTYDFSNGFKPTGSLINIATVVKPALLPVVKEQAVYLFAPGEHTEGDGFLYQNRLYHDIFIRKSLADAVAVSTTKASTTPASK